MKKDLQTATKFLQKIHFSGLLQCFCSWSELNIVNPPIVLTCHKSGAIKRIRLTQINKCGREKNDSLFPPVFSHLKVKDV